jgi:hypothetical protein
MENQDRHPLFGAFNEIESLEKQNRALREQLQAAQAEIKQLVHGVCTVHVADLKAAQQEIERLKSGKFSHEEFHNLCHENYPCNRLAFERGCEEYQEKLFGPKEKKI